MAKETENIKHGITGVDGNEDSPETSRRLSVMARGATRIPALRVGKIRGYSNSENSEGKMDRKKT